MDLPCLRALQASSHHFIAHPVETRSTQQEIDKMLNQQVVGLRSACCSNVSGNNALCVTLEVKSDTCWLFGPCLNVVSTIFSSFWQVGLHCQLQMQCHLYRAPSCISPTRGTAMPFRLVDDDLRSYFFQVDEGLFMMMSSYMLVFAIAACMRKHTW